MRTINVHALLRCLLYMTLCIGAESHAADRTESALVVDVVFQETQGVYIGFKPKPKDCVGNYKSAHALLPLSHPKFEALFQAAIYARNTQAPATIVYNYIGGCQDAGKLLHLLQLQ